MNDKGHEKDLTVKERKVRGGIFSRFFRVTKNNGVDAHVCPIVNV